MGIKVNNDGLAGFNAHIEMLEQFIEDSMLKSAEDGLNVARDAGLQVAPYTDRTGNLRASTGYTVIKDNVTVEDSKFSPVMGTDNGSKGISEGADYLRNVKLREEKGSKIIFVAGMDYASYVEMNHDVLAGASMEASRQLYRLLKRKFK